MLEVNVMNHSTNLRIFAAIPVAPALQEKLYSSMDKPRDLRWFQKWVHPADYHITVKFIGEISLHQVESIAETLMQAAAVHTPMQLKATDIGVFGAPKSPSILWAGLTGQIDSLRRLQQEVESRLAKLGYPAESRKYSPHITLARRATEAYSKAQADMLKLPTETDWTWDAKELVLYQTKLGRIPMYEAIGRYPLSAKS